MPLGNVAQTILQPREDFMQIPMKNQTFGRMQWLRQGSSLFQVVGTCGQEEENDPPDPRGRPLWALPRRSWWTLFSPAHVCVHYRQSHWLHLLDPAFWPGLISCRFWSTTANWTSLWQLPWRSAPWWPWIGKGPRNTRRRKEKYGRFSKLMMKWLVMWGRWMTSIR